MFMMNIYGSTAYVTPPVTVRWPISPEKPAVRRNGLRNSFGALLLVVLFTGCEAMNLTPCKGDERLAVQELLYFGTDTPSGQITPEAWAQFLREMVTPRFPEGLSTWQASGQWRSVSGEIIREPSYVVSLVHPDNQLLNTSVQEIIIAYKTRFHQEAVLRVKASVCMSLS